MVVVYELHLNVIVWDTDMDYPNSPFVSTIQIDTCILYSNLAKHEVGLRLKGEHRSIGCAMFLVLVMMLINISPMVSL